MKHTLQRLCRARPNTDTSHSQGIYKSLPAVTLIAALKQLPCIYATIAHPKSKHIAEHASAKSLAEEERRKKKKFFFLPLITQSLQYCWQVLPD